MRNPVAPPRLGRLTFGFLFGIVRRPGRSLRIVFDAARPADLEAGVDAAATRVANPGRQRRLLVSLFLLEYRPCSLLVSLPDKQLRAAEARGHDRQHIGCGVVADACLDAFPVQRQPRGMRLRRTAEPRDDDQSIFHRLAESAAQRPPLTGTRTIHIQLLRYNS
jgi:hypothetical protein